MKLSKELWMDEKVKWNIKVRFELEKFHHAPKGTFVTIVSRQPYWLFEILPASALSKAYKECFVIGIASSKTSAQEHLVQVVDHIYNKKSKTIMNYCK